MSIALDPRLSAPFSAIARRRRWLRTLRALAETVVLAAILFSILAAVDFFFLIEDHSRQQASLITYALLGIILCVRGAWAILVSPPPQQIALWIESSVPDLKHHALAAVELSEADNVDDRKDSPVFRQLLRGRVASLLEVISPRHVVPAKRTMLWLGLAVGLVLVQVAAILLPGSHWGHLLARATMPWANLARISSTKIHILEPTALVTHVAANESLRIKFEIESKRSVTPWIETRINDQPANRIVPISTSEHGFTFEAPVAISDLETQFRVRAGDGVTEWRTLIPSPRPDVESYEVIYTLPAYANEEPRTVDPSARGDLRSLVGSEAKVKLTVNQPLADIAVTATWDQTSDSSTHPDTSLSVERHATKEFSFSVPMTVDGRYQVQMTGLTSRLANAFPPRNAVVAIEDLPPRVRFTRLGIPSNFCRAKDVLTWQIVAEDELPLQSSHLEFAINDGDFQPVDLAFNWQDDSERTDHAAFRVTTTARIEWDIAAHDLKSGDLLKTRVVLKDLAGQETHSPPVVLRVASEYFTPDRHVYLRGRLQWLELMERWAAPATDAAEYTRNSAALTSTAKWLFEREAPAADAIELELVYRRLKQLEIASDQADQKNLVEGTRAFVCVTAVKSAAADLLALVEHLDTLLQQADAQPDAWTRRQAEMVAEYYRDCVRQIDETSPKLIESTRRELSGLSQRYGDLANVLSETLEQTNQPRVWLDRLTEHRNELRNRANNIVIEGGVPNRANQALKEILLKLEIRSKFAKDASKSQSKVLGLENRLQSTSDLSQGLEAQQAVVAERASLEQSLARFFESTRQHEESHRARKDFDPALLSALQLGREAFNGATTMSMEDLAEITPDETGKSLEFRYQHLARVADAISAVDAIDFANQLNAIWRPLLIDERWSRDPLVRRLENSRRWDYFQQWIEIAVNRLRSAGLPQEVINPIDRIRYDHPAGEAGRVMSQRRWDPNMNASAADDLSQMNDRLLVAFNALTPHRETAVQILQQYVPPQEATSTDNSPALANSEQPLDEPLTEEELARQLAEALDAAPEDARDLLERLEQELPTNRPMQSELSDISEDLLAAAEGTLRDAEQRERDLRRELERNDPQKLQEKRLAAAKLQDLGRRSQEVAANLMELARSAADQGDAKEAANQIRQAAEDMDQVSSEARSINENALESDLADLNQRLQDAFEQAAELMENAAAQAASRAEDTIDDNEGNRNRARDAQRTNIDRARDRRAAAADQRRRQWENLARAWSNEQTQNARAVERDQQQLEKAQASLAERPDDQWRREAVNRAQAQLRMSQRRNEALATATTDAQAMEQQAAAEVGAIRAETTPALADNNPAAAAARELGQQATSQLNDLANRAELLGQQLQQAASSPESLELAANSARHIESNQAELGRRLQDVAEGLDRAARHEDRLQSRTASEQLNQAAEQIRQLASNSLENARQAAENAAARASEVNESSTGSTEGQEVSQGLQNAQEQLASQVEALQTLREQLNDDSTNSLAANGNPSGTAPESTPRNSARQDAQPSSSNAAQGSSSAGNSPPSPPNALADLATPEGKARLLDDLDRLLNEIPSASGQPPSGEGEEETEAAPLSQRSALLAEAAAEMQRQQAMAAQQSSEGSQFAQASQRLAEAMLQQQMGDNSTPAMAAIPSMGPIASAQEYRAPATEGTVEPTDRREDWAQLRTKQAEDVAEQSNQTKPSRYQRQIEAYFRAIAERSGQ